MSDDLIARLIAESVAQDANGDVARMTGESLPATESKSRAVADLLREAAAALRDRVAPVEADGTELELLTRLVKGVVGNVEFQPCAFFDEPLDCIRVIARDCSVTEVRINEHLTILEQNHEPGDARSVVGFTIKGVSHFCAEHGLPDTLPELFTAALDVTLKAAARPRVAPVEADATAWDRLDAVTGTPKPVAQVEADAHAADCGCYECDIAPVKADGTMTDLDTLAKDTWRDAKRKIIFHLPGEREQAERDAEGVILAALRSVVGVAPVEADAHAADCGCYECDHPKERSRTNG